MTAGRSIDYEALTQDALRGVARAVLKQVAETGLPGDHHFYVAFDTQAPGVVLSRRLREKYPDEMMIVLQHRFWDLMVSDEMFEVKLTFDGIPERLVIPFQSIRVFFDPSVRFTLQFGEPLAQDDARDVATPRRRRREGAESDASGASAAGERRPRSRPKGRGETVREGAETPSPAQTSDVQPQVEPFVPKRPLEVVPTAVPAAVAPAGNAPAEPVEPAASPQPAGAKVFSLDQFRKK